MFLLFPFPFTIAFYVSNIVCALALLFVLTVGQGYVGQLAFPLLHQRYLPWGVWASPVQGSLSLVISLLGSTQDSFSSARLDFGSLAVNCVLVLQTDFALLLVCLGHYIFTKDVLGLNKWLFLCMVDYAFSRSSYPWLVMPSHPWYLVKIWHLYPSDSSLVTGLPVYVAVWVTGCFPHPYWRFYLMFLVMLV